MEKEINLQEKFTKKRNLEWGHLLFISNSVKINKYAITLEAHIHLNNKKARCTHRNGPLFLISKLTYRKGI